jgi:hypothetical protein
LDAPPRFTLKIIEFSTIDLLRIFGHLPPPTSRKKATRRRAQSATLKELAQGYNVEIVDHSAAP